MKNCKHCGSEFYPKPTTPYQVFCSKSCQELHSSERDGVQCWKSMIQRCTNSKAPNYKYYGGRGISVCERWTIYENFISDMGPRPSLKHKIERGNNDGNYEPGNCRWATQHEQSRNTRNNKIIEARGKRQILADWANEVGLLPFTLGHRINHGWSIEEALSTPAHRRDTKLTHEGIALTIPKWAKRIGLDVTTLYIRLKAGWSVEKALTVPRIFGKTSRSLYESRRQQPKITQPELL